MKEKWRKKDRNEERKEERMNISSEFYRNLMTEIRDMLENVHLWPNLDLNDGHARTRNTLISHQVISNTTDF